MKNLSKPPTLTEICEEENKWSTFNRSSDIGMMIRQYGLGELIEEQFIELSNVGENLLGKGGVLSNRKFLLRYSMQSAGKPVGVALLCRAEDLTFKNVECFLYRRTKPSVIELIGMAYITADGVGPPTYKAGEGTEEPIAYGISRSLFAWYAMNNLGGKHQMTRSFERAKQVVGDRPMPGYTITCSQCGKEDVVTTNTYGGSMPPEGVARKFRNRGWIVATKAGGDVCPECAGKKKAPVNTAPAKAPQQEVNNVVSINSTIKVEPPREMTRDDRRVIFAKLNEIYIDEHQGYDKGWSDKKVAQDLGVPLAWVRDIREENFGQETGNAEVEALLKEAQETAANTSEVLKKFNEAFNEKMKEQQAKIARLEIRIQELTKLYGK